MACVFVIDKIPCGEHNEHVERARAVVKDEFVTGWSHEFWHGMLVHDSGVR